MEVNVKNRNRSPYSFANINLLGGCNQDCYFCLGKDLSELEGVDTNATPYGLLPRLDEFLEIVKANGISKIYITGQTTDALMYGDLDFLISCLKDDHGFFVGIRTNGVLAEEMISTVNNCNSVGYTMLSLQPALFKEMTGTERIPNWATIFRKTSVRYRVSIVVTRFNVLHLSDMMRFIHAEGNPEYIQLRRISTDCREDYLAKDMAAFDFAEKHIELMASSVPGHTIELYEGMKVIRSECKPDVVLWKTVSSTANSMNYFSDGTISDEYFIVEGYKKNAKHR
jgi:molybdenum cofactor biosynthesis enzyme MoaA